MHEEASFAPMGKPFQEKLAQLILNEPTFGTQIQEVLNTDFFELKYLQVFVKLIFDYKVKFKKFPSEATMETILRSELGEYNETVQKQVRDYFVRIKSGDMDGVDEEYVKEKSLDFCKKQTLKEAMLKSVPLVEKCSFDEISQVINAALKKGSDNNHGYDFIEHFEQRYADKFRFPVSTGWDVVDKLIQGGHGRKELGVVIAPTGAGKSMVLSHLGAVAVMAGLNVVHYTLELNDDVVARRYDAKITGFTLNSLKGLKDEVFEKVSQVPGRLLVKYYPTRTASTETIRNHLTRLKQRDFEPDLVIVDYGDLLRPMRFEKEKRTELETIYEDLRAIAGEFDCPVWTASQTNRSGLNAEVVTMEAISEAYNKCFVADFIFSVSRTIEDKNNNTGRIFIAKNRNGPDGIVCPIFMDTSRVEIQVMEPVDDTIPEIEQKAAARQKVRLAEKYKKFKTDKTNNNDNGGEN